MSRIQKVQAITRIGRIKAGPGYSGQPERRIGEFFELDLDNPRESKVYSHLFRHGAIKPFGDTFKKPLKDAAIAFTGQEVTTESAPDVAPAQVLDDVSDPTFDESEVVSEVTDPPETETEPEPETEPVVADLDLPLTAFPELDFLTEDQIDTLRRMSVKTIGDVSKRNDNGLYSVKGFGKKKVTALRDLESRLRKEAEDG